MRGGLKSFAIAAIGARNEYFPVTYLRAFSPGNVITLGLDLGSDSAAREAMDRASDTGQTTLTAPLGVSRGPTESEQVAAMVAPVYAAGPVPKTVGERQTAIRGFVVEAFSLVESVGSTLGPDATVIGLKVSDANATLFTCPEMQRPLAADFRPALARTVPVTYGGREWTLEFAALPPFHVVAGSDQPKLVLIAGILISALLSGLVGAIAYSCNQALALVGQASFAPRLASRPRAKPTCAWSSIMCSRLSSRSTSRAPSCRSIPPPLRCSGSPKSTSSAATSAC